MNRRKFFQFLGIGTAVAVVAPTTLLPKAPVCVAPPAAYIGSYFDYVSFTELALAKAIDEQVADAAKQLSHRATIGISV